jgi:Sulfotransferase family
VVRRIRRRARRLAGRAKRALNAALRRTTGFELRRTGARRRYRPPESRDRLLTAPTFVLCTVRSGSTLLRVLLDSHSEICAPQELNLRDLVVTPKDAYTEKSLEEYGLDARQLEYVLWDWVLHRELEESGKRLLVSKAPRNVFVVDRIRDCWPDARFIFLLRHPGSIARSRHDLRPQDSEERNAEMVRRYADALEQARGAYDGLTVRYEELAADPSRVARELCEFLGVAWEPTMLDYGRFDHGRYRPGVGDWKEKIKSGEVQPPEEPPAFEEIHPALRELTIAWGYAGTAEDGAQGAVRAAQTASTRR